MTDILLAHGFFLAEDEAEQKIMRPHPPLGLLYLSAYLKRQGFRVEVFDSTFRSRADFVEHLQKTRPALVGLYSNLMTKRAVLWMMQQSKAFGARVVVGGPDPPYYAEEYLAAGADVVVIGEGEETLAELLQLPRFSPEKLEKVNGIAFRAGDGRVQRTAPRAFLPDLDALPFPDREAVPMQAYLDAWRRRHGICAVSIITARGCPYTCTWCSHSVFGKSLRRRSVETVVEEIAQLQRQYAPDLLWFADDVFNIQPRWLKAFQQELRRRSLRIEFECICRADRMTPEMVELLRDTGCRRIWIGSESGSQRILDRMKRGVKAEQVRRMVKLCRAAGMETGMFLMWGYEGETREDIEATLQHVADCDPDIVLTTVAYPIKGTEYYEELARQNRVLAPLPWQEMTDRDYRVPGRPPRLYYHLVDRRLQGEAVLRRDGSRFSLRRWRARLNVIIGKAGMRLGAFDARQANPGNMA